MALEAARTEGGAVTATNIEPGQIWVRRRDKTEVTIDSIVRGVVTFTTVRELLVYQQKRDVFLRNYRTPSP